MSQESTSYLAAVQDGFAASLAGRRPAGGWSALWQPLGFEATEQTTAQGVVLRLAEGSDTGRGRYLIRPASSNQAALQIPHGDSDRRTGDIGQQLFTQMQAAALAQNSLPRTAVDLAHARGTVFLAFTRAWAQWRPAGRLIQIHGFDNSKRREGSPEANAGVILSNGTDSPDPDLLAMRRCLEVFGPVLVYGQDARELGGTRNLSGQILRANGPGSFRHIELSRPQREALSSDPARLARLATCL